MGPIQNIEISQVKVNLADPVIKKALASISPNPRQNQIFPKVTLTVRSFFGQIDCGRAFQPTKYCG
jgi:hypothetical protein